MNEIRMYTVDAFASKPFQGNTCAVCILEEWLPNETLQNIAQQNLFAETAFILTGSLPEPKLRWFSASQEVDFCGHGSLSAAFVYLNYIEKTKLRVTFSTKNNEEILVRKNNNLFTIHVPAKTIVNESFTDQNVLEALNTKATPKLLKTERGDLLIIYDSEDDILSARPNFTKLMDCGYYGYILTSPSSKADYAYRYFSPRMTNSWEDPVNGASQTILAPYWSKKLEKEELHGVALSKRGGKLFCKYNAEQNEVFIGGEVCLYQKGTIYI